MPQKKRLEKALIDHDFKKKTKEGSYGSVYLNDSGRCKTEHIKTIDSLEIIKSGQS